MEYSKSSLSPLQNIRNISSNLALVLFNLLISLWYTPFLVHGLGSELFGFIPLANSVINFLGIITLSLNTATGRFLTIELGKNNTTRANQIFNTTLTGSIILISSTLPIAMGLVILVPNLFNVPVYYVPDVRFLFIGTICAFFLTTLRSNFLVATFAKNRFDLRNIVALIARIGQIVIIVILFRLKTPSLLHISLGAIVASILSFIGDYSLWKRLLPGLRVNFRAFRKKLMNPLMSTSVWVLVYQIGSTLFINTDMLVANRTLELSTAGMFGALLVIPKNLRIMASAVGSVWAPTFLTKFSNSDLKGMDSIVLYTVKLIGFTIALPVGLIAGLAKPFLKTWLGAEYAIMTWVLVVMICHLSVNLISIPFVNVQVTLNKMALPAIFSLTLGVANYILAVNLSRVIGAMGIVAAGGLMLTANNFLIMPLYAARIMNLNWWHYLRRLLPIILATLGVAIASYALTLLFPSPSLFSLLLMGFSISCVYLIITYRFGLSGDERDLVIDILGRIFSDLPGQKRD